MRHLKTAVALPFLALLLTGCASASFVRGVREYVPDVATELRTYATADAALDTSTKADRIAAADTLEAAAKAQNVTLDSVRSAWVSVREPYTIYVDADPNLDPDERGVRAKNIAKFDGLIEAESRRWIYGGQR